MPRWYLLKRGQGQLLPRLRGQRASQVWSLTQFYPVDFSQSRIGVKSACSTNAQSRFALAVLDGLLAPPCLVRHNWRCPCISVVLQATHMASRGSLKGAVSAQKALQGSETETRELLGGTEENSVPPMRGHWFALQENRWFFTKRKQKKWISGQTWCFTESSNSTTTPFK